MNAYIEWNAYLDNGNYGYLEIVDEDLGWFGHIDGFPKETAEKLGIAIHVE
jgi:hypothetical protein